MSRDSVTHIRSADGFTLIEMLVTLVVFSLVMVVMTNGLRTGAAVWTRVENRMGTIEQIALCEQVLSGFFDRAYPVNTLRDFSDVVSVVNTRDRFSFIHYSPPWPDKAGYSLVELQIKDGPAGKSLELVRHRVSSSSGGSADGLVTRTSQLITGVDEMEFSYLEQDPETGVPAWQGDWKDPDILPKVARLVVTYGTDRVAMTFQINNALAPECVLGRAGFNCEARR